MRLLHWLKPDPVMLWDEVRALSGVDITTTSTIRAVAFDMSSLYADDGGDGGPATRARLGQPRAITVDHTGNLVIDDKDARWTRRDAEVASDVSVDTMSHTLNGVARATPFRWHSNADMARSGGCDADGLSLGAV